MNVLGSHKQQDIHVFYQWYHSIVKLESLFLKPLEGSSINLLYWKIKLERNTGISKGEMSKV